MLKATNIQKTFGTNAVLRGVDVSIAPGEVVCVIGPSGTGKTTLLRALSFLDQPDAGTIDIDGNVTTFPLDPKARIVPPWPTMTAVFQSLFLWPHLTLRENIMLPARNVNPKAESEIEDLITFFEMGHFIDNYPNQASIGQRQRVALARALILNPRYILMDEITSALDIEQTAKILTKLEQLKKKNIGMFVITHAIGFAKRAADKILFMDDGKVVEQGSAAILDNPKTKRLKKFLSMVEMVS